MKDRRILFFALFIYVITGLYLLQFLGWYTDSPDTIFYLTISKKYANGNFYSAINNYWSPLISWFLIPFHLCGTDPLIAFKTLQLILGGIGLILMIELSRKFIKTKPVLTLFALACIPVFLSYALLYQTPDLLFLSILLLLFLQVLQLLSGQANNPYKYGIWLGITGGLLFLSKAFGFPFFISAILLLFIFNYFKIKEKKHREFIYLASFAACISFFVISLSWMYCLKIKYGTFTTGYAQVYNFNLLHPEIYTPGVTKLQHPVLVNGLMDITSREEASAWESPGISHQRSWNPFERKDYFIHYLHIIKSNIVSFYYFIIKRNIGALFVISVIFYLILVRMPLQKIPIHVKLTAFLLLVFILGYSLVFFMPRYLWLAFLLMPLISFQLCEIIVGENNRRGFHYMLFAIFTLVILIKKPVKELLFRHDKSMSAKEIIAGLTHVNTTLEKSYQQSRALPALIEKIKSLPPCKGNVAGFGKFDDSQTSYTQSLLLCMYLEQTYFGELPTAMKDEEKLSQIHSFAIDYLYCWEPSLCTIPGGRTVFTDHTASFSIIQPDH